MPDQAADRELDELVVAQRRHRWIAKRTSTDERVAMLGRLKGAIVDNLDDVKQALFDDLLRAPRAAMIEIGAVLGDLDDAIAHLDGWMADTPVPTAAAFGDAHAEIRYESRGVVLLFGPWNFPFGLVFQPLVPILAAGNTAIVKPNELAPATSAITARIIRSTFEPKHVAVVEGGVDLAERLLDQPVDHVFFTGSPAVGRTVMGRAARHLASVTLELGGKCPAIVGATADVAAAVKQIAIGKHQNAGQVCLSPDHVWIHDSLHDEFVGKYMEWVSANLCRDGQLQAERLGKIIDQRNYDRIIGYIEEALTHGAQLHTPATSDADRHVVAPGLLTDVDIDSRIMRDEIFGPILPVLRFSEIRTVVDWLRAGEKPLAMYVFSNESDEADAIVDSTSSGGVTINGWALHFSDSALPFGGVGSSGMGRYHGVHGFRELSHARSVFTASPRIGPPR